MVSVRYGRGQVLSAVSGRDGRSGKPGLCANAGVSEIGARIGHSVIALGRLDYEALGGTVASESVDYVALIRGCGLASKRMRSVSFILPTAPIRRLCLLWCPRCFMDTRMSCSG